MESDSRRTTYYRKVGRRYIPVSEYDPEVCDAFPKGTHMVQSYPGGSLRRFNIDPKFAPMIAAGRIAEEVISRKIMEATEIRRRPEKRTTPLTPGQKAAWDKLVEEFGEDARQLEWPSVREIAEAGVNAMVEEAEKLMSHPMAQAAYEEFEVICKLVNEQNK